MPCAPPKRILKVYTRKCGFVVSFSMWSVMKQCVVTCNLDQTKYKSHYFRIGGASHAHSLGYSNSQIQMLGRWKTSAFLKYIRPTAVQ